jgi:hypothetical protein
MTVEEVREAREDDPAGHAFRQRFAERPGAQSGRPRLLPALLTRERHTRSVAVPAGYAIHDRARAIKQTKKGGAGAINALERRRRNRHRLALPRHPLEHVERDVPARREYDRHRLKLHGRCRGRNYSQRSDIVDRSAVGRFVDAAHACMNSPAGTSCEWAVGHPRQLDPRGYAVRANRTWLIPVVQSRGNGLLPPRPRARVALPAKGDMCRFEGL